MIKSFVLKDLQTFWLILSGSLVPILMVVYSVSEMIWQLSNTFDVIVGTIFSILVFFESPLSKWLIAGYVIPTYEAVATLVGFLVYLAVVGAWHTIEAKETSPSPPIPSQSPRNVNWRLIVTGIVSFVFLAAFPLGTIMVMSFMAMPMPIFYFVTASITLLVGLASAFTLKRFSKSTASLLAAGTTIGTLCAVVVSGVALLLEVLSQISTTLAQEGKAGPGRMTLFADLFGPTPNPLITGIIIVFGFNVFFIILFFAQGDRELKDLKIPLYGLIIYVLAYLFLLHVIPMTLSVSG